MPNGKIQEEHKESLKAMGVWMRENGETIYGTSAGPLLPTEKMAATRKGKTIYLHILDQSNKVFLEDFDQKIKSIKHYKDKSDLKYQINEFGLLIEIPEENVDPVDTIVEVVLK